jgi:AAA15 family ATPase/GTPase
MRINKLAIKHFKTYENVEFNFIENVNIFTGRNNCGKTTILEALALWNECFIKLIKQSNLGDFRLGNTKQNLFTKIVTIKIPKYEDIFYNLDLSNNISLTIEFQNYKNRLSIGFIISPACGNNYNIYLDTSNGFDYKQFNQFFTKLPNPINTIYTSPIANILIIEEFERDVVLKTKILQRKSIEIIRNRLSKITNEKQSQFLDDLSYVLTNSMDKIELKPDGDYNKDIFIGYTIKLSNIDIFKDISLLGSGTLQIIEILLSLYEINLNLNLILLDEPDSHIHRDIQKRLIKLLEKHTDNTQMFITTHNESLIRSSNPNYIFHIENNISKTYYPITYGIDKSSNIGLQSTKKLKILKELGGEDALDFINALESEKLIFVEGRYDPIYIQLILDKKYINKKFNVMYWNFEGVNNIYKNIQAYKTLFSNIKNETSLWEKSVLIFDKDYLTKTQAKNLSEQLRNKLNIPVHIWSFYTIESVLLSDISKFAKLLYLMMQKHNIISNIQDIHNILEIEINKKSQEKLKQLETKQYKGEINKWIQEKSSLFKNLKLPNNTIGDFHDFYIYIKTELENHNFEVIATKDDIQDICGFVYEKYKFNDYKKDIFYELLEQVEPSTWFKEWDNIIKLCQ